MNDTLYLVRIIDPSDVDSHALAYAQGYQLNRSHHVGTKPEATLSIDGIQVFDDRCLKLLEASNRNLGLCFESIWYRLTHINRSLSLLSDASWISGITATRVSDVEMTGIYVEVLPEFVELGKDGRIIGLRTKKVYE